MSNPKSKLKGLFRIFCLSFDFCFSLFGNVAPIYSQFSFVIFKTFTDVKRKKGSGGKKTVLVQEWDFPREEETGCIWSLEFTKATNRNRSVFSTNASKNGLAT